MPKGPKGEKRPVDVIGNAVHVMRIATGQIEDVTTDDGKNAAELVAARELPKPLSIDQPVRITDTKTYRTYEPDEFSLLRDR